MRAEINQSLEVVLHISAADREKLMQGGEVKVRMQPAPAIPLKPDYESAFHALSLLSVPFPATALLNALKSLPPKDVLQHWFNHVTGGDFRSPYHERFEEFYAAITAIFPRQGIPVVTMPLADKLSPCVRVVHLYRGSEFIGEHYIYIASSTYPSEIRAREELWGLWDGCDSGNVRRYQLQEKVKL